MFPDIWRRQQQQVSIVTWQMLHKAASHTELQLHQQDELKVQLTEETSGAAPCAAAAAVTPSSFMTWGL